MYITYYICNWTIEKVHIGAYGGVIKIREQGQKESHYRYLTNQVRSVYIVRIVLYFVYPLEEKWLEFNPCLFSVGQASLCKDWPSILTHMKQSFINISYLILLSSYNYNYNYNYK